MAYTQTDVTNLEAAIARGELTVQLADRRVTYRSMAELKDALAFVEHRISQQSVPRTAPRHLLADFSESDT